jgi:hypothetical protein
MVSGVNSACIYALLTPEGDGNNLEVGGAQLRREAQQLLKVGGTCSPVPNGAGATVYNL